MDNNLEFYLVLLLAELSYGKQSSIIQKYNNYNNLKNAITTNELDKILEDTEINKLKDIINSNAIETHKKGLLASEIGIISIDDEQYPESLKNIHDPPFILYYRGNIDLLKTDCIAIVGSRVCTRYGSEQAERFAKDLSKSNFTIVSGLADGIDTHAHRGTLDAKGKTIAVMAGGLNNIYPATNLNLAREIIDKNGLLISENVPQYLPKGYSFIQRNRIIAGLSLGVFVPEMGLKSGAMHTVNYANDEGRNIFLLPGNVTSSSSLGTNNLIKTLQGACVTEPNDIIKNFENHSLVNAKKDISKYKQLDMYEQIVIDLLKIEGLYFDEILEKTKLEPKKLISMLTTMEIRGLIKKLAGNFYTL